MPKHVKTIKIDVANLTALFVLTIDDIQNGDVVQVLDIEHLYIVTDDTNLNTILGYTLLVKPSATNITEIENLVKTNDFIIQIKGGSFVLSSPSTIKTDLVLVKADVGLGNVDNTSDINKPVSTAQATAIGLKLNYPATNGLVAHTGGGASTTRLLLGTTSKINVTQNGSNDYVFTIADNPILGGTGSVTIPTGTTAQRDTLVSGKLRFNTDLNILETVRSGIYAPVGKVVQSLGGNINVQTGTSQQFYNNSAPAITGTTSGFEIFNTTITPIFDDSIIEIAFSIMVDHSAVNNRTIVTTIIVNGVLSGVTATNTSTAGRPATQSMIVRIPSSGAGVALAISVKSGANGNGTTYINRGSTATMGNSGTTNYTLKEVV